MFLVLTGFNMESYHLITTTQNFEDSKQLCIDKGMNLAVITSPEEQDFIKNLIQ